MGASVLFDRWRQCVLPYLRHLAIVFAMWRTLAPLGKYDWTCASFSPLESTTKMANGSVQPFLHSLWQKVPMLYNGHPYPPELPLLMGHLDLPCNTWCFGTMRVHNRNGTSIGSTLFCTDDRGVSVPILYNALPVSPSKLPLPILASGPHVIRGSLGPPESGTQMTTGLYQPFLQGSLVWQTSDRQTDRPR